MPIPVKSVRLLMLAVLICTGCWQNDDDNDDKVIKTATSIKIVEERNWSSGSKTVSWNAPGGAVRMDLKVDDFHNGDLRIRVWDAVGTKILDNGYWTYSYWYYVDGKYSDVDVSVPGVAGVWTIDLDFDDFTGDVKLILEDLDSLPSGKSDMVQSDPAGSPLVDPSYGTQGAFAYGSETAAGKSLAMDFQGRTVVAGTVVVEAGEPQLGVWRLLPDGTLDPTFGQAGEFLLPGYFSSASFDVAVDAQNRPLVTGWVSDAGTDIDLAVLRLTTAGGLDTTYDGDGIAQLSGTLDEVGTGLALDVAGRAVVSGTVLNRVSRERDALLARFTTSGSLDAGFATGGIAQTGGITDVAFDVIVSGGTDPVMVGVSGRTMNLWKYTSTGLLDPAFGVGGVVRSVRGVNEVHVGRALTEAVDGSLAVAGLQMIQVLGQPVDLAVWHFSSDGSPTVAFDGDGFVTKGYRKGWAIGADVAFDAASRVLVAGRTKTLRLPESDSSATLWRFLPDGSLDATMNGSDGLGGVRYDVRDGDVDTRASSIIVTKDGDLFGTGTIADHDVNALNLLVWKLTPGN